MKNYRVAEAGDTAELAEYPELVRTLLTNRGITTRDDAEKFLNPSYERDLNDPYLLKDMDKAVERIVRAIEGNESILIYGDYDCDGISASVIIDDFFKTLAYPKVRTYIPDRHEEGYGLHMPPVEEAIKDGTTLIITVDVGIRAVEQVARAQAEGVDVVVTDHHLAGDTLPAAYAIINPHQPGCDFPEKEISGAVVAFKLVQALVKKLGTRFSETEGFEKWFLDVAALGTMSDMMPLRGENRAIVHFGMQVIRRARRLGMARLLREAKLDPRTLAEDDLSFTIIPRINAASRMSTPRDAFDLLSAREEGQAGALAKHLAKINDERKLTVAHIMKDVKKTLGKRESKEVIVIGNPGWRIGVLGLVSSKITEEYGCPSFVWGVEGGTVIKGSCRSDGSVNVVELMSSVSQEVFLDYGGHEYAGGFSVSHEQVHFLEERLSDAYSRVRRVHVAEEAKIVDAELTLDDVTEVNAAHIAALAPFGAGNPKPEFLFRRVTIAGVKLFGKEKNHLELTFRDSRGRTVKAIQFFSGPDAFGVAIAEGAVVDLVATFEKSYFMGRAELRLRIIDIVE